MTTNHLDKARQAAEFVDREITTSVKAAAQIGAMHALIDIAESLRQLAGRDEPKSIAEKYGIDDSVPYEPVLVGQRTINLADYALEHVGGVDDE
jgi:hypothetical protein